MNRLPWNFAYINFRSIHNSKILKSSARSNFDFLGVYETPYSPWFSFLYSAHVRCMDPTWAAFIAILCEIIFSHGYNWLVVFIPRLLEVQIISSVAHREKSHNEVDGVSNIRTNVDQVYSSTWRIIMDFALKFEVRVA